MSQNRPQPDSSTPEAPAALKAQLRAMYGRPVTVSRSVDDAVKAAARRAFAEPVTEPAGTRRIGVLYRIAGVFAAAAAIALVLILSGVFTSSNESPDDRLANERPQATMHSALAADVNSDGRVNIIDAYLLQRRIERNQALDSQWDLDGNGAVDRRDVQAIATAAVRIQRVSDESFEGPQARWRVREPSGYAAHPALCVHWSTIDTPTARQPSPSGLDDSTVQHAVTFIQADAPIRFTTYDIIIDTTDAPLAVYQLDISAGQGEVQITGIEGGEHAAFKQPPYYDPQAMQQNHIIIAAFNTADADQLPRGKVRVATLHVQITGDAEPKFEVKLDAAATVEGKPIEATATVQPKRTQL
ncbi:MAG: dockerin type I repeat-containing protein [Phycisphaeraceae bacterium]